MDNHYVITISREFASLGRSIAQLTAKELGIYYMDRDIVEETAKRLGLPVSEIGESEERVSNRFLYRKFPLGRAPKTLEDEIFQVQSNIIQDTAASRDCIIVGRCAESVLRNRTRRLSIYIRAPYEARLRNCIESLEMDYSTAERMIHDVDLARERYRERYVYELKDEFTDRDIIMDSSAFGVEGTAALIAAMAVVRPMTPGPMTERTSAPLRARCRTPTPETAPVR